MNAYYDCRVGETRFKPYVGGGIGLLESEINSLFPSCFPALGAAALAHQNGRWWAGVADAPGPTLQGLPLLLGEGWGEALT